ncbi:hypothetical protein ACOMHN_025350 [Nucella lapillus]
MSKRRVVEAPDVIPTVKKTCPEMAADLNKSSDTNNSADKKRNDSVPSISSALPAIRDSGTKNVSSAECLEDSGIEVTPAMGRSLVPGMPGFLLNPPKMLSPPKFDFPASDTTIAPPGNKDALSVSNSTSGTIQNELDKKDCESKDKDVTISDISPVASHSCGSVVGLHVGKPRCGEQVDKSKIVTVSVLSGSDLSSNTMDRGDTGVKTSDMNKTSNSSSSVKRDIHTDNVQSKETSTTSTKGGQAQRGQGQHLKGKMMKQVPPVVKPSKNKTKQLVAATQHTKQESLTCESSELLRPTSGNRETPRATTSGGRETQKATNSGGRETQRAATSGGKETQRAATSGGKETSKATTSGGREAPRATTSGGKETPRATTSGGKETQRATTSGGRETQRATTSGGRETPRATTSGGRETQRATTSGGRETQRATTSGGRETQRATTSGGRETPRATTSGGRETQRATTSGGRETQRATTSGGRETPRATTSGGRETQRATTSGGRETQRATTSGGRETYEATTSGSRETHEATTSGGGETIGARGEQKQAYQIKPVSSPSYPKTRKRQFALRSSDQAEQSGQIANAGKKNIQKEQEKDKKMMEKTENMNIKKQKKTVLPASLLKKVVKTVQENVRTISMQVVAASSSTSKSSSHNTLVLGACSKKEKSTVTEKSKQKSSDTTIESASTEDGKDVEQSGKDVEQSGKDVEQSGKDVEQSGKDVEQSAGQSLMADGQESEANLQSVLPVECVETETSRHDELQKAKEKARKKKKKQTKRQRKSTEGDGENQLGVLPNYVSESDGRLARRKEDQVYNLSALFSGQLLNCPPAPPKSRPNYFFAVQITNPEIKTGFCTMQRGVEEACPKLKAAFVGVESAHLTLGVMHLPDEEAVARVISLMDEFRLVLPNQERLAPQQKNQEQEQTPSEKGSSSLHRPTSPAPDSAQNTPASVHEKNHATVFESNSVKTVTSELDSLIIASQDSGNCGETGLAGGEKGEKDDPANSANCGETGLVGGEKGDPANSANCGETGLAGGEKGDPANSANCGETGLAGGEKGDPANSANCGETGLAGGEKGDPANSANCGEMGLAGGEKGDPANRQEPGSRLTLEVKGLDTFRDNVVFAKVTEGSALDEVKAMAEHLRSKVIDLNISMDSKPFAPHITLMKMSKNPGKLKASGIRKIDSKLYQEFKETHFGTNAVTSIQLCAMIKPKQNNYYHIEHEIPLI